MTASPSRFRAAHALLDDHEARERERMPRGHGPDARGCFGRLTESTTWSRESATHPTGHERDARKGPVLRRESAPFRWLSLAFHNVRIPQFRCVRALGHLRMSQILPTWDHGASNHAHLIGCPALLRGAPTHGRRPDRKKKTQAAGRARQRKKKGKAK
jgi:hypothetical protein